MPNLKFFVVFFLGLIAFLVNAETLCPVVESDSDSEGQLTKVYYLPTTYVDSASSRRVILTLQEAEFFQGDAISIGTLPSSNSYTGPGSSEYDGLALAIAEKVLERDSASAGTAIDPHVDNVINFYNNGITNREAVDIYRAGTNRGIYS